MEFKPKRKAPDSQSHTPVPVLPSSYLRGYQVQYGKDHQLVCIFIHLTQALWR